MLGMITTVNCSIKTISAHRLPNVIQSRNFFKKLCEWFCKEKSKKCSQTQLNANSRIETRGMSMPMVGLGTWQVKPECVDAVICYALDVGYRHIDTSHSYGNQAAIGATLTELLNNGKFCRNDIFISSKLPYYGMKPEMVPIYVKDALTCLCLEYIDLFMIHFPVGIKEENGEYVIDPETNHIEIWKALEEEVAKGTVKSLGLSNFNVRQIQRITECATILPANVQVEMHLYLQQKQLCEFCRRNCIGMTAYAPLGSPGLDQYLMQNCLQANKVPQPLYDHSVNLIAGKYVKTPAQVLLRYLLQNGVAVIPKSSLPDRICRNFELFDFELDSCEMEELCQKDMGEKGRMFSCNVWVGTEKHPEYPFIPN